MGCCRLCLEQHPLVDSHIIPSFLYKPLKEKDGFYFQLSTGDKKESKVQKGVTEYLFCKKCDNERLQKNEDYLARLILGGTSFRGSNLGSSRKIEGLNYQKTKLALLSILWRMSLSKHSLFNEVTLGLKHEEALRCGIMGSQQFGEEEYPILLTAPLFQGRFLADCIMGPSRTKAEGNTVYRCVLAGFLFSFAVGSNRLSGKAAELNLRKDGSWVISLIDVNDIPFLRTACVQIGQRIQEL